MAQICQIPIILNVDIIFVKVNDAKNYPRV